MNARLKNAREYLGLSQEFVAVQMGLTQPEISSIESGRRKMTADELARFSGLYGVSVDEFLYGRREERPEPEMPGGSFSELSDIDQREIMNLLDFKRRYKAGGIQ